MPGATKYISKIADQVVADVLRSGVLGSSKRQASLLLYLLKKSLKLDVQSVTAKSIAIDLFGRPDDFDDKVDSIVRVEMHRLRKNLAAYNYMPCRKYNLLLEPASFEIQLDDACSVEQTGETGPPRKDSLLLPPNVNDYISSDAEGQSIASEPSIFDNILNRRLFWLAVIAGGVLYLLIALGYSYWQKKNDPLEGITLNKTYKARVYLNVVDDEQYVTPQAHNLVREVAYILYGRMENDNTIAISGDEESDYILTLKPIVDKADNREKLSAEIYTNGGIFIWSHQYVLDPNLLLNDLPRLADDIKIELVNILEYVEDFHRTNPEVEPERRAIFSCVLYAESHTMPGRKASDYIAPYDTPLDCLKPETVSNDYERAIIHSLRADYYIHANVGNVAPPIEAGKTYMDKVREELDMAEATSPLPLAYYMIKLKAQMYTVPNDADDFRKILSEVVAVYPNSLGIQKSLGFYYAYYLNDWDEALKWPSVLSERERSQSMHLNRLLTLQAMLQGNYKEALRYRTFLPDNNSTLVVVEDTVLYCLSGQPHKARLQKKFLKQFGLSEKDKFIAYVKKRNFHPVIEALYTDERIFENCTAFSDAE